MELRHGYKQSEVGIIPYDWTIKNIESLGDVVRGGSPRPAGDPKYFKGSFIPWLTVAALTNIPDSQLYVTETVGYLTKEGAKHSRTLVNDTIIIANSGATLGVAKLLGITCCANDGIAAIINQTSGSKGFVCHYINSRTKYLRDVVATGNGQPNLNTTLIRSIPIPFPPAEEQHSIATALSDIDALIMSLSKLIAKKCNIKQGVMQILLTGKKRLPGFSDEWKVKTFGELFDYLSTATNSRSSLSEAGDTYYIHYGDIHTKFHSHLDFRCTRPPIITRQICKNAAFLKNGDWVMADVSEDYAGVGKAIEIIGMENGMQAVAGLHTFLLREKSTTFVSGYKGHLGNLYSLHQQYLRVATGMKVFGVSKAALKNLTLNIPSLEEQAAIATILTDMDADIAAIEARLKKTLAIKQCMMQTLLTGRVRLI